VSSFLQQHEVRLVYDTLGIVDKVYSLLFKGARLSCRLEDRELYQSELGRKFFCVVAYTTGWSFVQECSQGTAFCRWQVITFGAT
jgi:hypothetical protein